MAAGEGQLPNMRIGCSSEGELLSVQAERVAELVEWRDRRFPAGEAMADVQLPGACRCATGVLPHEDLDARFPKAMASGELEDQGYVDDDMLEQLGTRVRKEGERFRNLNCFFSR